MSTDTKSLPRFPFPDLATVERELSLESAYRRRGKTQFDLLVTQVWQYGRNLARTYGISTGAKLPDLIAEAGVVTINAGGQLSPWGGLLSEYRAGERTIVLHTPALQAWSNACGHDFELLEQIALAHEFFHHLHCTGTVDPVAALPIARCQRPRPLPPRRSRHLLEACAHAFASVVGGAFFTPK